MSKNPPFISTLDGGQGPKHIPQLLSNDINTVSQLASKLKILEQENSQMKVLLKRANDINVNLQKQVDDLKNQGISDYQITNEISQMKSYAATLENQIFAMETFLDKQGMVYLEDEEPATEFDENQAKQLIQDQINQLQQESSTFQPPSQQHLEQNIRKLNQITARKEFIDKEGITHLQDAEGIPVKFYLDGIYVKRGPFRSYQHESARQFVIDIADGFVPSELSHHYPEGVSIVPTFENQNFLAKKSAGFSGPAKSTNGDQVWHPDQAELEAIRKNYNVLPEHKEQKIHSINDKNDVLAPMPLSVLLGKIQDKNIAGHIADIKGQGQQQKSLEKTILVSKMDVGGQCSTLRIKLKNGQNIVLKLGFECDVGEIYASLSEIMKVDSGLISVVRALGGEVQRSGISLQEAGLTPNCRLFVNEVI